MHKQHRIENQPFIEMERKTGQRILCVWKQMRTWCNTVKWEQLSWIRYHLGGVMVFSAFEEHES